MAAKIILARGDLSVKQTTSPLNYGEMFWSPTKTGELGTLYIGKPNGSAADPMAIAGARAMESLFYKGTLGATDTLPLDGAIGDFYIFSADNPTLGYKAMDWAVNVGVGQWARVNNSGGSADDTTYVDNHDLGAVTVQDAIDTLAAHRLQYAGTFDPSTNVYPSNPVDGDFFIATKIGVITTGSVAYKRGDAALYTNGSWTLMPFSFAFPADGIEGAGGEANYLTKFDSEFRIIKSSITDNGSTVEIHNPLVVDGTATVDRSLIVNSYNTSGDLTRQTTVSATEGAGNLIITLPATSGTLQLVGANIPANTIVYNNTGTGAGAVSLVATDIQAAITELAQGKMAYAGTISAGPDYPASPVIGGLYLLTADVTLNSLEYTKGDWAFYDPTYAGAIGGWTRIPAGLTTAADTAFDTTGVTLFAGTAVTETNVQSALAYLYGHKADLDANGKLLVAQMPEVLVGALQYQGTFDASAGTPPTDPKRGQYYVITAAGTIGGVAYTIGDWIVYSGTTWQNVQGGATVDAITVGASILQGSVAFGGAAPITVTAALGTVTIGANAATKLAQGVVQVGDGIAVDTNGKISVDAYKGLTIDSTDKKLMLYLNAKGLEIDSNSKLGIKAGSVFTFPASGLDEGKLVLADTGVVAGVYPKVTVNAQGQITAGGSLIVSDIPISTAGTSGATGIYDSTTGVVADLTVKGPIAVSKAANNIILDFTQTDAIGLSPEFAVATPTDFGWSARATGSNTITSIVGAVNANREDLNEYVALLRTQGAAIGTAAGANLIGADSISGVKPTGGAVSGNSTLQAMLEGLAAYTNSQIAAAAPNITGTPFQHVMFNSAGDAVVDSVVKQSSDGSLVTVNAKLSVGQADAAHELDVYGPTKFFNTNGLTVTTFAAPTGVAGGGAVSTTQYMPDQNGQLINSNSSIDGGVYV
jgi:hypothetical protein